MKIDAATNHETLAILMDLTMIMRTITTTNGSIPWSPANYRCGIYHSHKKKHPGFATFAKKSTLAIFWE
jgi:hypothetical protein